MSDVSICNSALIKIGADRINSLEEENKRSQFCKEQFPKLRDALLRAHPWNFAIRKAELAKLDEEPLLGFSGVFQLPTDVLRVLAADGDFRVKFKIEGRKLFTDEPEVNIRYISRITDTTQWDPQFTEVLAWKIAKDLAFAITGSLETTNLMNREYQTALRDARSSDAQETIEDAVISDLWLDSRL